MSHDSKPVPPSSLRRRLRLYRRLIAAGALQGVGRTAVGLLFTAVMSFIHHL
jgi:hypothetical protein